MRSASRPAVSSVSTCGAWPARRSGSAAPCIAAAAAAGLDANATRRTLLASAAADAVPAGPGRAAGATRSSESALGGGGKRRPCQQQTAGSDVRDRATTAHARCPAGAASAADPGRAAGSA